MENAANTITTAMVTAVTTIASDAVSGIAAVVPVAAPIFGGLLIIGVVMKTVRKFNRG